MVIRYSLFNLQMTDDDLILVSCITRVILLFYDCDILLLTGSELHFSLILPSFSVPCSLFIPLSLYKIQVQPTIRNQEPVGRWC